MLILEQCNITLYVNMQQKRCFVLWIGICPIMSITLKLGLKLHSVACVSWYSLCKQIMLLCCVPTSPLVSRFGINYWFPCLKPLSVTVGTICVHAWLYWIFSSLLVNTEKFLYFQNDSENTFLPKWSSEFVICKKGSLSTPTIALYQCHLCKLLDLILFSLLQ